MKHNKNILSCEQAKEIDLVNYLSGLGYHPKRISGSNYWYLSPLRNENTPSFKIDRHRNAWYDHGIGEGGNIIDLAIKLLNCTVKEFLDSLSGNYLPINKMTSTILPAAKSDAAGIHIIQSYPIKSTGLYQYLNSRKIPLHIARTYCSEVSYELHSKYYYSIGFKNDLGGYELRNAFWKSSSTPKGITTFNNKANKVAVFEGFFDFLSFLAINKNQPALEWNFCILNSLAFFEKSKSFLDHHASIHLFLDNDEAGQNCSRKLMQESKKYIDESSMYNGYKDLNDWLVNMGKYAKQISIHHSP